MKYKKVVTKSNILKMFSGEITFFEGNIVENITIGFLKQDLDFVKVEPFGTRHFKLWSKLTLWKNMKEINHQLASRTDYESDAYTTILFIE